MLSAKKNPPSRILNLDAAPRFTRHGCEISGIGRSVEESSAQYRFDNRTRERAAVFQYTLGGEGRFRDNGSDSTHAMKAGRGFLAAFPSDTSYWLPDGGRWEHIFIILRGEMAVDHAEALIRARGHVWDLARDSMAVRILFDIYEQMRTFSESDPITLAAEAYRFLLELSRRREPQTESIPAPLRAAARMAAERLADPMLGVDALAAEAGYSRYYFSRLFKQHYGISPYRHIVRLRLRKALELLGGTAQPIKQVAAACGFSDYPYFCNVFRRQIGATPGSIRRQKERFGLSTVYSR